MPHPPEGPRHWADGGETKLNNLVTLCRHHHRAVHEGGFDVRMNAKGQPEFRDPNGKILPRHTKHVSAETCIPDWGGEVMDGDMVVGALMELDQ